MKETIKCCIACILPCGALDVIRIVHSNGHVEEISGTITASEIMKAHPKHVLKKPSSSPSDHDERDVISATKTVVVSPKDELQRGKIYFLVPATISDKRAIGNKGNSNAFKAQSQHPDGAENCNGENNNEKDLVSSDRYLPEKVATQKDRRKGRVGVWKPHLESISEIVRED